MNALAAAPSSATIAAASPEVSRFAISAAAHRVLDGSQRDRAGAVWVHRPFVSERMVVRGQRARDLKRLQSLHGGTGELVPDLLVEQQQVQPVAHSEPIEAPLVQVECERAVGARMDVHDAASLGMGKSAHAVRLAFLRPAGVVQVPWKILTCWGLALAIDSPATKASLADDRTTAHSGQAITKQMADDRGQSTCLTY